ncbi:MAG: YceI family protein [Solidesulfovibrio sp. DCME]|uniref:YceI family protein n=1 Tax=Solidesulfovibrio sp. DCME TaxID=3447380 RepID=UPI003D0BCF86
MRSLAATILLVGLLSAPGAVKAQAPNSLLLGSPPQAGEPAKPADAPKAAESAKPAEPASPVVDGATLDPAHTSTVFWIRHILAPVAGRFDAVAGTIDIPPQHPAKGRVTFTVKTASVDTGVAARDKHLNTAEFLDTAAYPEMKFTSDHVTPFRRNIYKVTGKLTIKDVTKTVTIPVRSLGTKPHPMMPCVDVSGFEAVYSLNRLEYHVGTGKYFKMGAVGDTVDMRLAGETLAKRPGCVQGQ